MEFYELKNKIMGCTIKDKTRGQIWHRYLHEVEGGIMLEFGVWGGRSINYMADVRPDTSFFGFDSFEGLPEDWITNHPAGTFKVDMSQIRCKPNVKLVPGWFNESIPNWIEQNSDILPNLKGIHIDCDLGSSTKVVLELFSDIILSTKPMILFDELYNYKGFEDHEFKAFLEWVNLNDVNFDVISRNEQHQQVLIQIK